MESNIGGEFESVSFQLNDEKKEETNNESKIKNGTSKSNLENNLNMKDKKDTSQVVNQNEILIKNPFSNKPKSEENIGENKNNLDLKRYLNDDNKDNNEKNNKNTIINNEQNNEIKENEKDKNIDPDNSFGEHSEEKKDEKSEEKKNNVEQNKNNNHYEKNENKDNIILTENIIEDSKNYFKDDKKIKMTRFSDMENNSYLNSVVRCIVSIDELTNFFLKEKKEIQSIYDSLKTNIKKRLSFAIQRVFVHMYIDTSKSTYPPDSIKQVLEHKNNFFKNKSEMPPNICLNYILNKLHDELNSKNNNDNFKKYNLYDMNEVINIGKSNFLNNNDSIISKTFSWYELEEICCYKCKKQQYRFQSFLTYDLDISNFYEERKRDRISIFDCLEFATSKKNIKNFYCGICNSLSEGYKIKKIVNSPKIFVFIIDRGYFEEKMMKINFTIDPEIDIFPYTENIKSKIEYKLIGIVSIFDKKYISFVKNKDGSWYVFADSKIAKIKEDEILKDKEGQSIKHIPCILFYQLIQNN